MKTHPGKDRGPKRPLLPLLITALIFLSASGACSILSNVPLDNHGVNVGRPAPDFTLEDASGKWLSLSDFRGRKVFLFSWSTWCRCKYQLPALEEFYREHKSDDFDVIAVASDSQGFKWVSQYLEQAGVTFQVLIDPNNSLAAAYNFWATENGWLIDEAGIIRMNQINFDIRRPEQKALLLAAMAAAPAGNFSPPERPPLGEQIANARQKAQHSLSLAPRFALADLLRQGHDPAGAESVLRDAVKRDPLSAEARWRLGVVYYEQGRGSDAEAEWQKAARLAPTNYLYLRNLQALTDPDRFYSELADCGCAE